MIEQKGRDPSPEMPIKSYRESFLNALVAFCHNGRIFTNREDASSVLEKLKGDNRSVVFKLREFRKVSPNDPDKGIYLPSSVEAHLEECFGDKVRVKEIIFTEFGADVEIYPFEDNKKRCNEVRFVFYPEHGESELFVNDDHVKGREIRQLKSETVEGFMQLLAKNCRPDDQYFEAVIYRFNNFGF